MRDRTPVIPWLHRLAGVELKLTPMHVGAPLRFLCLTDDGD